MSEHMISIAPGRRRSIVGSVFGFFLVRILIMGVVLAFTEGFVAWFQSAYQKGTSGLPYWPWADVGAMLVLCCAMVGLYALLVRLFERRWPSEARPDLMQTLIGLACGVGLFATVYGILTVMGAAHYVGVAGWNGVAGIASLSLMAGFAEELVMRGVMFRTLEDSFGTTVAMIVSAAVFGLLHAFNPGATLVSTVAIMLEAGLLLAAAYAWSRNLWTVFGLHFAWNFTEGGIFGAAVSGGKTHGLLNFPVDSKANVLLTGGRFGPEASLVAVTVCLALAVVFMVAAMRRGNWKPGRVRLVLPRG